MRLSLGGQILLLLVPILGVADTKTSRDLPPTTIYELVSKSTVVVRTNRDSLGSGVVVGKGEVATNHHVVVGASEVTVHYGARAWNATVLASNKERDIALLSVPGLLLPRAQLRKSSTIKVGEPVFALGAPKGHEQTFSQGIVSALRPRHSAFEIQTTAPISPGSSGGGLYDARAQLIGLTTFIDPRGQNLNFAHPSEWITWLRKNPTIDLAKDQERRSGSLYSARVRPEVVRCQMEGSSMWGIFSGGMEVLETRASSEEWIIEDVDGQTPTHTKIIPYQKHPTKLVLEDIDRNSGLARFRPIDRSRFSYWLIFKEDQILLIRDEIGTIHGEVRTISTGGECVGTTKAKYLAEVEAERELARTSRPGRLLTGDANQDCLNEDAEACFALGRQYLGGRRWERSESGALDAFRKACRLGHGEGCFEAALLYGNATMVERANEYLDRACRLGHGPACR